MKKVFGGGSWTRSQPKASAADPDGTKADAAASSKHGHSSKDPDAPKETKHEGPKITAYVPPADSKSGDETPRASDGAGDPGASVSSDGGGDVGDRFRYTCVRQVR